MIAQAAVFLRVMLVTLPFTTYFQSVQAVLKICKDVKIVILMTIVGTWLIRVPVAYVLVKFAGLDFYGLVLGFLADYLVRSAAFGITYKKRNWLEVHT